MNKEATESKDRAEKRKSERVEEKSIAKGRVFTVKTRPFWA